MALNSMGFLLFTALAVAGYYLIPGRFQWIWLLVFSYLYYGSHGAGLLGYLLFSTVTTYAAGRCLERISEKKSQKTIVIITLVLTFGMRGVLKYLTFIILNVNRIFQGQIFFLYFSVYGIPAGCLLEKDEG